MTDQILTTAEIAAELRCSKAQVYRLLNGEVRDVPKLPCISLGRKKVVRRSSFEEWNLHIQLARRRVVPPPALRSSPLPWLSLSTDPRAAPTPPGCPYL